MKLYEIFETALPMDAASRMQRAKDMGFTVRAYHGTGATFKAFDLDKGKPAMLSGHGPHFADKKAEAHGYAADRKADGKKAKVLDCLLRIKNPFVASYNTHLSAAEFTHIVGRLHTQHSDRDPRTTTMDALRELSTIFGWERDKYADTKKMWSLIYQRLIDLGYDAITFPDTPPDFSQDYYTKIVLFDPKNVRSIKAAFDPAKSNESNLKA
jgi:hypothetical protein